MKGLLYVEFLLGSLKEWSNDKKNRNSKEEFTEIYEGIYNAIYNSSLSSGLKITAFNTLKDIKAKYEI